MSPALRPILMLLAFAVLAAAPAPAVVPALVAAALMVTGLRAARSALARRSGAGRSASQDAIVLGADRTGRAISVSDRELAAHALILGASGAGKTTSLLRILTEQIRRGRPVIAIDLKGSPAFAVQLREAAASAGRPFQLWTPDGPARWNPLEHGNATELKDKLIGTERFTEPHYQRAAERYLLNLLQVAQAGHPRRATSLGEVVALMDPHRLRGALRGLPPVLHDRVQDYLAPLSPDQLSAVRGLQTRLALLTESHTGPYLAPDLGASRDPGDPAAAIDLRRALDGPEVVLFSLNSGRYGKLASQLGSLVVQDLVCAAGDRLDRAGHGLPVPRATVAIDEFSGLGAESVLALFARGRESGLGVVLATQEMADLDRAAHGLRDQVLGNTALKLAHRQDVPASAQTIAQMIGTEKTWEETERVGGWPFGAQARMGGTRRQAEQFVVHPNEIKTLGTGDAVLLSKLKGGPARTVRVAPPAAPFPPRGPSWRDRSRSGPELG